MLTKDGGMVFYDKKPSQILVDLINESNPNLGMGIRQLENTRLTTPKPYPTNRDQGNLRVIKAFTTTGDHQWWVPEGVENVDILVIAGGGAGGDSGDSGGGGAGGLIFYPNYPVRAESVYHLTVGNGGVNGEHGDNSHFDDLLAIGGGSGSPHTTDGGNGGSGGGAGGSSGTGGVGIQSFRFGPSGVYGFGNQGGSNRNHVGGEGMGGGGAGEPAPSSLGIPVDVKLGGAGLCQVTPDMGPYEQTYRFIDVFGDKYGHKVDGDVWFSGGGGGGGERGTIDENTGGIGGGGDGGHTHSGRSRYGGNAMANTGGGGGGGDNYSGGNGGTGIVLIAYNNPLTNKEGYKYDHINTVIDVYPQLGQPVKGKATFYYRRLDVGNIFKNKIIRFGRWRENNTATIEDICGWLNEEYGTEFVPSDFPSDSYPASEEVRTLTVNSDSYAYIGKLRFIYNPGSRSLDQIFNSYDIDGVVWDLKHGGETDPRPLMTLTGYGVDYTDFSDLMSTMTSGQTLDATPSGPVYLLIERFNNLHQTQLSLDIDHTEPNGLSGLVFTRHTLPNTTVDEANSDDFKNVVVITSKSDSWFGGRILFHYNPR